jgi:hypothetical protein
MGKRRVVWILAILILAVAPGCKTFGRAVAIGTVAAASWAIEEALDEHDECPCDRRR